MDTETELSIQAVADATTVKQYGHVTIVDMPHYLKLSESQRAAVMAIVQRQQQHTMSDAQEALADRLRCMTPPVDEEEERQLSLSIEAEARHTLELEGCPPCYPRQLDVSQHIPPDESMNIVRYWKSFPGTYDTVLDAQLTDWKKFRMHQAYSRRRYQRRPFSEFITLVHGRLQNHGITERFDLCLDPRDQGPLPTWGEFHHYHLRRLEQFQMERQKLADEANEMSNELINTIQNTDSGASEQLISRKDIMRNNLTYADREIERHMVLLRWIENTKPPHGVEAKALQTPVREARHETTASRVPTRRQKQTGHAVLGKAKVSKPQPKVMESRRRVRSAGSDGTEDRMPTTKETTERAPVRRSRVVVKKSTSRSKAQIKEDYPHSTRRAQSQRQDRQRQPLSAVVMTRSGRKSEPPVRWVPH